MVKELVQITNPLLRERLERGLVSNLINAKANLGLGLASIKWTDQLASFSVTLVRKNFPLSLHRYNPLFYML